MREGKFTKDRLPQTGESCAVAPIGMLKVACLLFDKVHVATIESPPKESSPLYEIPEEVTFGLQRVIQGSKNRLNLRFASMFTEFAKDIESIEHGVQNKLIEIAADGGKITEDKVKSIALEITEKKFADNQAVLNRIAMYGAKSLSETYSENGIKAVPLYPSNAAFATDFPDGENLTYQAAINNLPLVPDASLTWDEILEFRKDREAVRKYRAFRLWLSDGLKAQTLHQAQDLIAQRLDDYDWAIKKHLLKSTTGIISQILSVKNISALSTGAMVSGFLGGPIWSAVTAGLLIGSNISVWIAERKIERKELDYEAFADVALLYQVKQVLAKKM